MCIPVQKYKSQYKNKSCGTKNLKKNWTEKYDNSTTMCFPIQKYKFQYKNKSFGTEKYFLKNLEKIGRYFIYDYYYVPKYMLIIVYLNKPYIFHYYKLSRLYSTKHHLTPLYHTIHPYKSPIRPVQHHAPLYLTIYLYTSPHTPIHHYTSMYDTIHPYTSPYTHVSTHV